MTRRPIDLNQAAADNLEIKTQRQLMEDSIRGLLYPYVGMSRMDYVAAQIMANPHLIHLITEVRDAEQARCIAAVEWRLTREGFGSWSSEDAAEGARLAYRDAVDLMSTKPASP